MLVILANGFRSDLGPVGCPGIVRWLRTSGRSADHRVGRSDCPAQCGHRIEPSGWLCHVFRRETCCMGGGDAVKGEEVGCGSVETMRRAGDGAEAVLVGHEPTGQAPKRRIGCDQTERVLEAARHLRMPGDRGVSGDLIQ